MLKLAHSSIGIGFEGWYFNLGEFSHMTNYDSWAQLESFLYLAVLCFNLKFIAIVNDFFEFFPMAFVRMQDLLCQLTRFLLLAKVNQSHR